jgi:uncharacterized protein
MRSTNWIPTRSPGCFKPAAEWLAAHRTVAVARNQVGQSAADLRLAFEQFIENYSASSGRKTLKTLSTRERDVLFAQFMQFLKSQGMGSSAR